MVGETVELSTTATFVVMEPSTSQQQQPRSTDNISATSVSDNSQNSDSASKVDNVPTQDIIRAKCGDNSIISAYTSTKVLVEMEEVVVSGLPDFNTKFKNTFDTIFGRMRHDMAGITAISMMSRKGIGPSRLPSVGIERTILHRFPDSPAPRRIPIVDISFSAPIHRGYIGKEILATYLRNGQPDLKALESTLGANLQAANPQFHRSIGAYIDTGTEFLDNTALYAKLLWNAHIIDMMRERNIAPQPSAWAANDQRVQYIDLTNPAVTADQLGNAIAAPGFVFIERSDYARGSDDIILEWLCQPGRRIATPEHQNLPHAGYISWPYIPITVARRGPFAPLGVPVMVTAQQIYAYVRKLATARNEQDALSRAISWVQQNSGVEFRLREGRGHMYAVLWPDNGAGNIQIAGPEDYNALLRMIKITPTTQSTYDADNSNYLACGVLQRLNLTALYCGLFNAFATTAFADVHFDTLACRRWASGEEETRPDINLMRQFMLESATTSRDEAEIYRTCAKAFKSYADCNVNANINFGRCWSSIPGTTPNAYDAYFHLADAIAPVRGNLLAIDYWLTTRPIEWGIPGDPCEVNFTKELCTQGRPEDYGWFSSLGDSTFTSAAAGDTPYTIIPYGPMGVNVICQALDLDEPVFETALLFWEPERQIANWRYGQPMLDAAIYEERLRCYQPCTLRTYNQNTREIAAPSYPTPDDPTAIATLAGYCNTVLDNVGFSKPILHRVPTQSSKRPALGLPAGFKRRRDNLGQVQQVRTYPDQASNRASGEPPATQAVNVNAVPH